MTKQKNAEFIAELEAAITGLNKYGWDFPFGTLLWDVKQQGAFCIEKLFDFEVIAEDKIGFQHQEYLGELLSYLRIYKIDFKIYNFSFSAPDAYKVAFQEPLITETNHPPFFTINFDDLICGKTLDNCWIGIIRIPDIPVINYREKLSIHDLTNSSFSKSTKVLLNELENLLSRRYNNYIFTTASSR